MSFIGLKKQISKANQYLSETVGTAQGTKLDDVYCDMEKKVDITSEVIAALIKGIQEYLQPNPAIHAKMAVMNPLSRVSGTATTPLYTHVEGVLAESMENFGRQLGDNSDFGMALLDAAKAYSQIVEIKYQVENIIKQKFLEPLIHLQNNELKNADYHRTKLNGRRLDYDCKKRQRKREEETIQAGNKMEESKRHAEMAMFNILSNDVEQISQLFALTNAQLEYHRRTTQVLEQLQSQLKNRIEDVSTRPKVEHCPAPVLASHTLSRASSCTSSHTSRTSFTSYTSPTSPMSYTFPVEDNISLNSTSATHSYSLDLSCGTPNESFTAQPDVLHNSSTAASSLYPCCKALFDFKAQRPEELEFGEGMIIELISQIDDGWFEGQLHEKRGVFPISYVEVIVPLQ